METVNRLSSPAFSADKYVWTESLKDNPKPDHRSLPKISIITVTYNSALTLLDTLKSVQSQDYQNIEHIIVDGNSQDDTIKIIKSFPHVNKWISEKDGGLYDAMNKGLQLATGDIIGILNSDDLYAHKGVLSKVAERFINNNIDALYGDLHYVNALNTDNVIRVWKSGKFKRSNFIFGWMPPHPTFFVRRELYKKWGGFDLRLTTSADYELMLRFIHKHNIKLEYIPTILVKMRMGGVSNNSLSNRLKANSEDKLAWGFNNLHPFWFTLYLKPLKKITQFIK